MAPKETTTEQLILEAAEAEFLEKGYGKARTTEIARRAGVNHSMLHYYFRTKENLFEVVFQKKAQSMSDIMILSFSQDDLPFLEKIRKAIEDHFDFLAANDKIPTFIFSEILYDEKIKSIFVHILRGKIKKVFDKLKQEIEREAAKGTIRYVEPVDLMLNIVALNVFVFNTFPILSGVLHIDEKQHAAFLQHRKEANIDTRLRQLKT
ncbi:MAG: TetR/AcrR family transcriptional regulator [Tannerellaceae bacterium]|nr:TetR/AcrR family transcriptional regulator [Tannerellaceae bacterium]